MNAAISLWLFALTLSANDADKPNASDASDPEPTLLQVDKLAGAEAEYLRAAVSANPAVAGDAYLSLADLCEKAGFPADAGSYLEQLVERFPNETFAGGKSAQAILDDFRARMKQAGKPLQQRADWWDLRSATIEFRAVDPTPTAQQPLYPHSPDLAYFKKHWLHLKNRQCTVIDATTGAAVWSVKLSKPVKAENEENGRSSGFDAIGHLFFFIHEDVLYGVSTFDRKILWSQELQISDGVNEQAADKVEIVGAAPGIVAAQNRHQLLGFDPLTGRQLWSRAESDSGYTVFGDSDYLFVVQPNGSYTALRSVDGVAVRTGKLPRAYRYGYHRSSGRMLFLIEQDFSKVSVSKWDAWAERDVWRHDFKAKTRHYLGAYLRDARHIPIVQPESDEADPAARLMVLDLHNGNPVLQISLDCKMNQLSRVDFFMDDDRYYVATEMVGIHLRYTHLTPAMHYVNVNGPLTAYDRVTGQKRWETEMPKRSVIADPGAELPVIIALESKNTDRQGRIATSVEVYDKKTGKLLAAKENSKYLGFTAIAYDATKKTIDLQSWNVGVHLELSDK